MERFNSFYENLIGGKKSGEIMQNNNIYGKKFTYVIFYFRQTHTIEFY